MRVAINLATRPYSNLGPALKRLRITIAVLGGLCLLFLLGLHLFDRQAADARERERTLDEQIARVRAVRATAEATMTRPDNALLLKQTEFLNQRFDEKAFSWTLAMEAMETVLPAGVQVTSIEPLREKDGHITVHVRVVGPRDRSDEMVVNLEKSRRFIQPRIVGESAAESTNGPGQRLEPVSASNRFEFDLLAEYNPPSPEEHAAKMQAKTKAEASPAGKPKPVAATPGKPRPMPPPPGANLPHGGPR